MVEMKIQWLETAQEDLRQLRAYYIDNAGINATRKRIREITERVSLLSVNPYLGKAEQELGRKTEQYRFLVCGDYKIYYYIKEQSIKIALLWDCRRNPKRLFDRLK